MTSLNVLFPTVFPIRATRPNVPITAATPAAAVTVKAPTASIILTANRLI